MKALYPDTKFLFCEKGEIQYRINPKYFIENGHMVNNTMEIKREYHNYFEHLDNKPNIVMIDLVVFDLNDNNWRENMINMILDFINYFNDHIILVNKHDYSTSIEILKRTGIDEVEYNWYRNTMYNAIVSSCLFTHLYNFINPNFRDYRFANVSPDSANCFIALNSTFCNILPDIYKSYLPALYSFDNRYKNFEEFKNIENTYPKPEPITSQIAGENLSDRYVYLDEEEDD